MRKLLLGTTAVAAAALFGAHDAAAQTAPTVRIGGYFEAIYANISDTADKAAILATPAAGQPANATRTFGRQANDFRTDFEIQVFVTGKAANGLSYGAVMELQMDNVGAGAPGSTMDVDEAYAFVSSPTLGTIRFGDEDGAANLLQVRAPVISGMGPDGIWDELVRPSASGLAATSGLGPSLFTGMANGGDSTKIIYLSPQFYGFDAGVSFAPNSGEGERYYYGTAIQPTGPASTVGAVGQRDRTQRMNEVSYGLRYRGTFSGVGIAAGAGGMVSDPATIGAPTSSTGGYLTSGTANNNQRQITAYNVGLNLSAYGFTVGAEYTWGNYRLESVGATAINRQQSGSQFYVLGATYTTGPLAFGVLFGQAEQDNPTTATVIGGRDFANTTRKQNVFSVGGAYTLAPGLELIASYTNMQDKNNPFDIQQTGIAPNATFQQRSRTVDVALIGTRLAF